ncbi:tenascin-X [Carassius gibelio]|uniref:tenascin-X n=1 Tax=Carassius gibelio TaxID=101364 RepID=UPI002277A619|nr:tenascin-X [Carassius gibelio]
MGRVSVKTVWKGTALLIFVMLQELNAETTTAALATTRGQTAAPATTSSALTESQTSTSSTAPATTNSPSTESTTSTPSTLVTTSSPSTKSPTTTPSKPGVIRNLTVNIITTSSVFLTWDGPVENISFFKINWRSDKINKTNGSSTTNTSYNITGLTAGVNYTFCITAVAADQATEGEAVCISQYTKPGVIRNLTVNIITTSSVFLTWDGPVENRSFFKIQWKGDKTNGSSTTNTSYNITGLTAGVNYTFCITAVAEDQATEGETVCISQYTKPSMIINLTVAEITTSSVFLTWDEPFGNRSFFKVQWMGDKTNGNSTTGTSYNITGLSAGVNYTLNITAVAADNSTEGESAVTSKYTKPDVIMNLTAVDITTSSVFLNWIKPNGQSSRYRVEYEENNVATENTFIKINGLTPGRQYTFKVFAVAADNETEGRANQISLYTKPGVISNLKITEITTSSLFLTWDGPVGNRSFFKVQWMGDETNGNSTTTDTSYNITGLTAGVNYTLNITAVAADNSTEGESAVTSKYTKPDVIMNLTAVDITTSSVFLNWIKPNGQSSRYRVEYEENNVATENTSIKINGLTPGAQYTFKVFAVAADNETEGRANQISLYTKPGVISNLKITEITTSSLFLTWDGPVGNRSFFKIQWMGDKTNGNSTTTNTSYNITGLTAGVNYTLNITAVAADNSTEGESAVTSKYIKPDVIMNLTAFDITTSSVLLNWIKPNGQSSRYRVEYENKNVTTENTSIKINDLIPGRQYTFKVFAFAADNVTEGRANQISLYTKPGVISNLKITEITTSSMFLTWDGPVGNRSFFKIQWIGDETNENSTTDTSYNITGLTAGVNYTLNITAVAADNSTEGESVVTSKYTKPDVIMNLTAVDITTSSVLLNWIKPNGQSSRYRVEYEDKNMTTENTSIKINDLIPGRQYTFKVFVVAADNVTEGRANQISLYTKPGVISNLKITEITTSSVFLTWDGPVGNRSFFKVQWMGDKTNGNSTTTNTSYNITGLTAGVNYTLNITAVAADNSTEGESAVTSKYTKPDVIMNLTAVDITTSSVLLNWIKPNGQSSGYRVEYGNKNVTTENTSIKINDLIPGRQYTFKVFAVAADNVTEGRANQISLYTKPGVISNLKITEITTSSVFLTWDGPVGNRSFFKIQWIGDETNENSTTDTSYNITGLTAGVNYTLNITAVAADNSTEGESVVTSKYTKPDVIMNLTAVDITTSSVLLNWIKPNGQSSRYRVEYDDKNVTAENTSIKINDLIPGRHYTFKVFAVAADHVTEGRANQISLYTKPGVISNLKITEITTSSVFLTWDGPVGNRSFFKVQWMGDKTNGNSTTTNTSYNITGLTAGVNYTLNITAVAADNSTEGESAVTSKYTKPDVIMNLTAVDITTSSVLLNWIKPNGQSSGYRVEYEDKNVTTENTSIKINDLIPGRQYTFKVFAVAADHVTEGRANQISLYTKPGVISNLKITAITTSSVFLTWDGPVGNRSFFKIQWMGDKTNGNSTTTNTSYNITGLTAGVNYTLNITAVAADNSTEGESAVTSKYTKPDVIMNLTAVDITTSSVLLNWIKPNGQSSRYRVEYENKNVTTENTSIKINDLIPGRQYTFKVFAVAADNVTEGRANQISLYTKPGVISNLKITEITTSSLFLTWDGPVGNRSFFKIQWMGDETNGNSTTTNTSYNITGLTAGVNYTLNITAVAADNSTEGESAVTSKYTKPDVIMNLTAVDITTSSVLLNWIKPNGQSSGYRVEYEDKNVTTENTSIKINDLIPGRQYTFKVFAVAADHVTEGRANQISLYTKPGVISNLKITAITTSSVFLTWDGPVGNRSFFKIQWMGDKTNGNSTTTNTSYNITGLTAGVNYTLNITAVAADNSTEGESAVTSKYTKPDVIMNLTAVDITTSSVLLNWIKPNGQSSRYRVEYENKNMTTENTSIKINDLIPGRQYTFKVFAVAADNVTEGRANQISLYTKPGVISNLKITEITTSSVFLTWDGPVGNRSFFKIQWMGDETNGNSTTTNTSYNITGLTAGVNYTLNITAVAADNSTEGESAVTSKYTKPDVIMNLTAVDITTSSVLLNWTKPNGQSSRYRVEYEDKNMTTENTSIKINDLIPGAQYTFKVFAVAADHVTDGRANQISLYTKPGVISNLKITEITTSSMFLTWDEPVGNRSFFKIHWMGDKTNGNSTTTDTSYNITGLTAGVNYTLDITAVAADNSTEGESAVTSKYTSMFSNKVHSNIGLRIEDYEEHFKQKHKDSNCGFAEEYEELKTVGTAQSKNIALAVENKPKNRYSNVLPYDASRVKLSVRGSPLDDYINANYIPGYNSRKEFIAAQGPLPVTVNEFWRMVWEKNVFTIVMLTRCNEMGRVKCEKYWPSGTNHYQNISVTTTSEIDLESWTIRDFRIKNVKTAETRYVRQFHFTAWPDHGVPQTTEVLIDFRHLVREHMNQYSRHSPTVVHCSAGVGRTGTFIAIDHLIFQIERDSMVDIYRIVNDMRMHRPLMVQTEEQYVYIHQCAHDIIRSNTGTNIDLTYENTEALSIYQNVKFQKM